MDLRNVEVIAELANAHGGDRSRAIDMVESISDSADVAKVQVFTASDLAVESHENYDLYQDLSLSASDIEKMVESAHEAGIQLFADILGHEGLERAIGIEIDGFKIHSSDLSNYRLIKKIAEENKPTLISVGGATSLEIKEAVSSFKNVSTADIALVYGFQNYPTKLKKSHLNRLRHLVAQFDDICMVGYASHVEGSMAEAKHLPAWAVAAGADFVEVHTTLDRSAEGPDYYSSLEPDAFEMMSANIEKVREVMGEDAHEMSKGEIEYRHAHKKCAVATRELCVGDTVTKDDVDLKRPVSWDESVVTNIDKIAKKSVTRNVKEDTPVRLSDVQNKVSAVLACRAESTRLYGKPLQLVGKKSILAHQISQLKTVTALDEIVLAISDTPAKQAFVSFAEDYDLKYFVGGKKDVLGRVVKAARQVESEFVVRTTTENPFIYQESVGEQISIAIEKNSDLVVSRKLPLGSFTEVVSVNALQRSHENGEDRHRSELVTSFITEHPESFEIIGVNPPNSLRRPDVRLTVDNPCDLILVRKIWNNLPKKRDKYDLKSIIDVYDKKGLKSINITEPDGNSKSVISTSWHVYGEIDRNMEVFDTAINK
ncbi:MAG: hypothetical protein BRD55_05520 [Bacteroidetes bacterium SW_9_63_38]|nr:MAG: hypothetical protein BRD55_05520 [Bacteroidetes bacterium SW_9_63_38]